MKAGKFFSAGAMAIAAASLLAPSMAAAGPQEWDAQRHEGNGSRSNDHGNGGNRGGQSAWHPDGGNAPRPAQAPQQAPAPRMNDGGMRHGGNGQAVQERAPDQPRNNNFWGQAANRHREAAPNRDDRAGWNRGDNDRRNGTWNQGDNRDSWRGDRNGWQNNRNDWRANRSNDRDRDHDRNYRRDDHRDYRDWDRSAWRRNDRYDWQGYRDSHRSVYRIGRYYAPYYGYSYRRVSIGFTLGSLFYGNRYWIDDPWYYRLPEVYGPYRWVRYYDDVLLVNIYTGEVVDVIYDFFW